MRTDEIIIRLFCSVDDRMLDVNKHPLAHLYPSEVVTIGLVFALKGVSYRAFYRWLRANHAELFGRLPEQSRLYRLLVNAQPFTDRFLADPTVLGIIDSIGIELIHPRREGRSDAQLGRKGISNHRWIVGVKLASVSHHFMLCHRVNQHNYLAQGRACPEQCVHPQRTAIDYGQMVTYWAWLINQRGEVVDLQWFPANISD